MTNNDLFEPFRDHTERNYCKNTCSGRISAIKCHFLPICGEKEVNLTTTADINKETKKDAEGNYILTSVSGTGEITLAQHKKADGTIDGLTTDIENKSGATLPSTGGIGTTLFYIVGAILVAGAGILLVTRRRMSAD